MKNYFKKFSIMFVMLLVIGGVGVIQNGTVANATTIGQALATPESGWKRYNDSDNRISHNGDGWLIDPNVNAKYTSNADNYITFKFYGTKLRLICTFATNQCKSITITIDNIEEVYSSNSSANAYLYNGYEKLNLNLGVHTVKIKADAIESGYYLTSDAIDIDDTGYLVKDSESISLNNTSIDLPIGDPKQLIATTTPAGAEVVWLSSDSSIATVDSNGKVTTVKEGQATITAQIKGSETKATCTVTVTPKGTDPNPPVEPTNPTEPTTGDANLFIELVDGQIKNYNLSSDEINKFKQWYLDRDNTKSNKPYYEFSKGDYKDYVIHDKIDWFEVR